MPTLKRTKALLFYVQCFLYLVSYSINVSFSYYMAGYLLERLCILTTGQWGFLYNKPSAISLVFGFVKRGKPETNIGKKI